MDPTKLAAAPRPTKAELDRAEDLYLAARMATSDHRRRQAKVWGILISRTYDTPPSWAQLFDDLDPARVEELRDLYDALPDGVRAEFDRRYG